MKAREGTGASLKHKGDRCGTGKLYQPGCTQRLNHSTTQRLYRENLQDGAHVTLLQVLQDFTCTLKVPKTQTLGK